MKIAFGVLPFLTCFLLSAHAQTPAPVFSVESGIYTNDSITLTLSVPGAPPGTLIYYVVNPLTATNLPTTNSTLYTGEIVLSNNTLIKARAFAPPDANLAPSPVVAKNYIFLDASAFDFSSPHPLIVITFNGFNIAALGSEAARSEGALVVMEPGHGRASLRGAPQFQGEAGFAAGGFFTKQEVSFQTRGAGGAALAAPLLDMPADSDWFLEAPFGNKTMLNSFLALELYEKMGHYAARRRFVEVFISRGSGRLVYPRDYAGVYVLLETVKAGPSRVNIQPLSTVQTNQPDVSGGFIFRKDIDVAGDIRFATTGGGGFSPEVLLMVYPDPQDLRLVPTTQEWTWPGPGFTPAASNQLGYLVGYLNQMEHALYASNWLAPEVVGTTNHYSYYLDADSLVDYHWIVEFVKCIDAYRIGNYMQKDRSGKVKMEPFWPAGVDGRYNNSFGNANFLRGGGTDAWYFAEQDEGMTGAEHVWLRRLINGNPSMGVGNALTPGGDPDFCQKIADRWSVLRTNVLDRTNVISRIDELSAYLYEASQRDLWGKYQGGIVGVYQWPNPDGLMGGSGNSYYVGPARIMRNWDVDYVHPLLYLGDPTNSVVGQMKRFVLGRYLWIDNQFTRAPVLSASDRQVDPGFVLGLTPPPDTTLYYTLDGTDPRAPGGAVSPGVFSNVGPASVTINGNVRVIARAKAPTNLFYNTWSGPAAVSLFTMLPPVRITEIMYHPAPPPPGSPYSTDDFEFLEVRNVGLSPLNLNGFNLSGGVQFQFPNTLLAAGQRAVVVANIAAFQSRYGTGPLVLGAFTGHLNDMGDHLHLSGSAQETILDFSFSNTWYPATDGLGFSLVRYDEPLDDSAPNAPPGTAAFPWSWRASSAQGGSPGLPDPPPPLRPAVVINEILTHEDNPATDAIELYYRNAFDSGAADVSNWYLTDDPAVPKKFRIPPSTVIPANGFVVFYETNSFGTGANGPDGFDLSSEGGQVYLFSGDGTNITGYEHVFAFGAAPSGVTFGRYITSQGQEHFVAQSTPTLPGPNAQPLVGPVGISTINYHPPDILIGGILLKYFADQYVRLQNTGGTPVPLYDTANSANTWRVRGDVTYDFPAGLTLPADGSLVLVSFDPAANPAAAASFRSNNFIADDVPLYGPWQGGLGNQGEVALFRPDVPVGDHVPYILVEKVDYENRPPWPAAADGFGFPLLRVVLGRYGNDPTNWVATLPNTFAPSGQGPIITNAPASQLIVPTLRELNLAVGALGTSPLHYQWRHAGTNIIDATNATFVLSGFQFSDAGPYDILVYNNSGAAVHSFTLTARVGLRITVPPVNVFPTNGVNTNVSFTITAEGTGLLRFQWRFNGVNIPAATSATLVVSNVQPANEGPYDCLVRDNYDTTNSQPVNLTIISKAVFVQEPLSQSAVERGSVTFSVSISVESPHTPPANFRWRRSGVTLTNGMFNGYILTSPLYSILTLTNLQLSDAAFYNVVVTNLAGGALGGPYGSGSSSHGVLTVLADANHDGLPDIYQTNFLLHPCFTNNLSTDGLRDDDGDGMSNAAEFVAGTDPCDNHSNLKAALIGSGGGTVQFTAVSNRTYSLQYRDDLTAGQWRRLADVVAAANTRVESVVDPNPRTNRLYRIVTPIQP